MATSKANEIYITRIYNAPVKTVWNAWTDLKQVAQWWGPRGFTITTHSKDLRPGGSWNYTMHGPDGVDYPNRTHYFEVDQYSRLVYDHGANDTQPALFRVTVLFSEILEKVAGKSVKKTKMEMTMRLATAEAAAEIKKFIKQAGGNSTWDRLAEYLTKEGATKEVFVINRTFNAPLELMYDMWTDPKHFAGWLPPTGFTMQFIRADIRPNGSSFYVLSGKGPGGETTKMYGRANYLEFIKPNRIVYTQEFCDEAENLSRHPMSPTWPATMLTTVELSDEGADFLGKSQTRVTVTWEVFGNATAEEVATFVAARSGMAQGWGGSFDKLEVYLEGLVS